MFVLLMPPFAENMVSDLLKALPSVKVRWDEHLEYWGDEERGCYNDMSVFAHHIVECYQRGQTDEFGSVFALIERFISEGSPDVRELATIGLLEDIQTIGSPDRWGYKVYEQWLGSKSRIAWQEIERVWEGKISLMDVVRLSNLMSGNSVWR